MTSYQNLMSVATNFGRVTFSPENKVSVKFTDDKGTVKGAVDSGGPQ